MSMMTRIGVRSLPLSIIEVIVFFAFTAGYVVLPPKIHSSLQHSWADARNQARQEAIAPAIAKAISEGTTEQEAKKLAESLADKEVGPSLRPDASMPVWVWIIMGVLYLLILTIWWAPGNEKDNSTELIAMAIVTCLAGVLAIGIYHQQAWQIVNEFFVILKTGGGRTG